MTPSPTLDPEKVAYWYFRLNGFLTIENFVVHPEGERGTQCTDADILGVRFPHRRERLFDSGLEMEDDTRNLGIDEQRISIIIAEIKKGRCALNGPWTDPERQNIQRVLAAIGCFSEPEIDLAAGQIYEEGAYLSDDISVRLIAVGNRENPEIREGNGSVVQRTWPHLLSFIWARFCAFQHEKKDVQQWDATGLRLKKLVLPGRNRVVDQGSFLAEAMGEMGIPDH